jgi:uncharacterized membrane protein
MYLNDSSVAPRVETMARRQAGDESGAVWIGRVLLVGVLLAAGTMLAGLGLALAGHGGPTTVDDLLGRGEAPALVRPGAIARGLVDGSATAYIQLGLLALILTPTARVALTLGLFLRQRDWLFAVFATVVLAVLVLGLIGISA